jgi:hypothetical protein
MHTEPQVALKFSVPPPDLKGEDPTTTFAGTVMVRIITSLAELFDYNLYDLRQDMSSWGEIVHPPGETYYELRPGRTIASSTFSQWTSGLRRMPAWRVAQAYVLLEWKGLETERVALSMNLPKTHPVRRCLRLAAQHTDLISSDSEVGPWLMPFRKALKEWLKSAAHLSPTRAETAADYEEFFRAITRPTA